MQLLKILHPRHIFTALDQIDSSDCSYSLSRPQALRRVFTTLACVSVALLFVHYAKYSRNLTLFLDDVQLRYLQDNGWYELVCYIWWTGCHLLGFVLLPWLMIRYLWQEKLVDFGWRLNDSQQHWRAYLLLLSPILLFVYIASLGNDFVNHYPFYDLAGRSWFDLLAWEFLYLSQFVFLEFFFRGFMLNALRPAIGANAVWVMCVPYLMIHFPKLWPEAFGAILFGLFLGILALQSRSIWGGVLVHAGVAVSMDIAALLRKGAIPEQWWPF